MNERLNETVRPTVVEQNLEQKKRIRERIEGLLVNGSNGVVHEARA
jgi:hypothetical protein